MANPVHEEPQATEIPNPAAPQPHHGYLITAHRPIPTLTRLVERLGRTGTPIVHVDAKSDITPFRSLHGAVLCDRRIDVRYSSWSMTEAAIELMRTGLALGCTRLTFLRESHYPIVDDDVLGALGADLTTDYIVALPAPDAARGKPEARFTRPMLSSGRVDSWWYKVRLGVVTRVRPPLDWRTALGDLQLRAGSSYWSLTAPTVRAFLDRYDAGGPAMEYFRSVQSSSETVFHTVVGAVSPDFVPRGTTFVRWDGGQHPAALQWEDVRAAMDEGEFWFAKKFDGEQTSLIDQVEAELVARAARRTA